MIFHFSMASSEAITYPTLNPANPYALEKVRNKKALSKSSCNFSVSGKSSAVTNYTYASSINTGISLGTRFKKLNNSSCEK